MGLLGCGHRPVTPDVRWVRLPYASPLTGLIMATLEYFQEFDLVYHRGRKQQGVFVEYDVYRTETNNTCWVDFDGDVEHVSVDFLSKA